MFVSVFSVSRIVFIVVPYPSPGLDGFSCVKSQFRVSAWSAWPCTRITWLALTWGFCPQHNDQPPLGPCPPVRAALAESMGTRLMITTSFQESGKKAAEPQIRLQDGYKPHLNSPNGFYTILGRLDDSCGSGIRRR